MNTDNKGPRTARDAMIAVALEEVDLLLDRVDRVKSDLSTITAALVAASTDYKFTVAIYTEQSKAELTLFLERKAVEVSEKTTAEVRLALRGVAESAFESEVVDRAERLGAALAEAANEVRRARFSRFIDIGLAGIVGGIVAAVVLKVW